MDHFISILTPGRIEAVCVSWTVLPAGGLCPLRRCLLLQQITSQSLELLACFFGRESVGDCVNLLFACLDEPEVLITVAGFREANHIIITALFAGPVHSEHWGVTEAPKRKTGVVPRVSQPSNLPLTLASSGLLGNWCAKQVKRYHFLKIFSSFWQSTV